MKKLVLVIALLSPLLMQIQAQTASKNNCVLHWDKAFYVTGEVAWYKLYLPKQFDAQPITIKVTVSNASGNEVDYFFLKSEGKTYVEGYYKIPFDQAAGLYNFAFSGVYTGNNLETNLAEITIPIYNDLQPVQIPADQLIDAPAATVNAPAIGDLVVTIDVANASVSTLDAVEATISVTDKAGNPIQGNLSVAVTDWTLLGEGIASQKRVFESANIPSGTAKNLQNTVCDSGVKFSDHTTEFFVTSQDF